jgi:hypothetical protein
MLLGDLLTRFSDTGTAADAVLGLGDLALLAAVQEKAIARGLEVGAFGALAVRQYAATFSEFTT